MIAYVLFVALQAAAVPVAPAVAATPADPVVATAASAVPGAAKPAGKLICQDDDTLGTRLGGHKTCMTKEQWRQFSVEQRDAVRHAQNQLGYAHQ